jgi:predicted flap endonuclease-1-like 5' DNA nuclease
MHSMAEFTTNQWAILALVLILGWFLGLLTMAGGRKWKRAFEQERAARIAGDEEIDRLSTRVSELEGERECRIELERERETHAARVEAANGRIAELEKSRAFVNPDTAGSIAAAASGNRDDLSLIFGVGRVGEIKLNDLGVFRFADIVSMSLKQEAELEGRMGLAPGTIADERWRDQAEMLRKGKYDEHARMFA